MKITSIRLAMLRVPLRRPFRTALRTVDAIEDVVVAITTDSGAVGYGSAPATPPITGDTHASIIATIRDALAPPLIGRDVAALQTNLHTVQTALQRNTSPKAAVDIALHDLWAQLHGAPLYRLLGGSEPCLTTDTTISVDTPQAMVAETLDALARGFDCLKVKVGLDVAEDIARVQAVHSAVAGRARLRLDANQGWSAAQAVQAMQVLEAAGIHAELLEQPVPAHDLDALQHVSEHTATPVMADEAMFDARQAITLLERRAAGIVNIKLMKTGGIAPALTIADIAATYAKPCMMGCMLESSIGVAAAAHAAAARPGGIVHIDLDAPALAQFDPVRGGARFDGPRIVLGNAPGLGIGAIDGLEWLPD